MYEINNFSSFTFNCVKSTKFNLKLLIITQFPYQYLCGNAFYSRIIAAKRTEVETDF